MADAKWMYDLAATMGAAQTHGMVPSPGVSVGGEAVTPAAPTFGGDAPPLGMGQVNADMPAPPASVPPVDPSGIAPFPGVDSGLHAKLVDHFNKQAQQAAAASQAAQTFLGPNGAIGQLYADSADKSRQAGDIMQAAEQAKGAGDVALAGQDAERIAKEQRQDEQRMRLREKTVREYQTKANVLADQAQNAEVRDFWADRSTGSRILGILAQTLSGAANGLAGNPGAPSPLDRIIDRDLEVQQHNLQNKRLSADRAQNALAHVYNGFKTEDDSIAAYRQAAAKWVQAKSNQLAAQFQSDTAPARNKMVQAKTEQDIAQAQGKLAESATRSADTLHMAADDNMVQLARDESNERSIDLEHNSDLVRVPGVSTPQRKQLFDAAWRKQAESFSGTLAQLDNIEKQVNKPGFSIKAMAQSAAGKSLLEGDVRQLLGTGANLSAYEEKSLKALSADYLRAKGVNSLTELGAPEYKDYIRAMRTAISRTLQARIRARFPGGDLAGDPGFESARRSLDDDDAEGAH